MNGSLGTNQPGAYYSGSLGVDQAGAFKSGSLGMAQPGAYNAGSLGFQEPEVVRTGVLGRYVQPGSFQSGSLGHYQQPGSFRSGSLGCGCAGAKPTSGLGTIVREQGMKGLGRLRGLGALSLDLDLMVGTAVGALGLWFMMGKSCSALK